MSKLTIVDLHKEEELSSSDMAKVAGAGISTVLGFVAQGVGSVIQVLSGMANAALDGAEAANDPERGAPPDLPGQQGGGLVPLRSP